MAIDRQSWRNSTLQRDAAIEYDEIEHLQIKLAVPQFPARVPPVNARAATPGACIGAWHPILDEVKTRRFQLIERWRYSN